MEIGWRSFSLSAAGSKTELGTAGGECLSLRERRLGWLKSTRLYLVCDAKPGGRSLEEVLRAALKNGVDIAQLRDKNAKESELVEAGRVFRRLCDAYDALFIVNDRPDLALACGADGLHVGQNDQSIEEARKIVGPDLIIGRSTHSPAQLRDAEGCDYISVGPVFETPTKPDYTPVGLKLVTMAAELATLPFFAIGGIDSGSLPQVLEAGAERVAVVRAIADASKPAEATRELRTLIDEVTES